jgi:hypothetical protein
MLGEPIGTQTNLDIGSRQDALLPTFSDFPPIIIRLIQHDDSVAFTDAQLIIAFPVEVVQDYSPSLAVGSGWPWRLRGWLRGRNSTSGIGSRWWWGNESRTGSAGDGRGSAGSRRRSPSNRSRSRSSRCDRAPFLDLCYNFLERVF